MCPRLAIRSPSSPHASGRCSRSSRRAGPTAASPSSFSSHARRSRRTSAASSASSSFPPTRARTGACTRCSPSCRRPAPVDRLSSPGRYDDERNCLQESALSKPSFSFDELAWIDDSVDETCCESERRSGASEESACRACEGLLPCALSTVCFALVAVDWALVARESICCFACSPSAVLGGLSPLRFVANSRVARTADWTSVLIVEIVPEPGDWSALLMLFVAVVTWLFQFATSVQTLPAHSSSADFPPPQPAATDASAAARTSAGTNVFIDLRFSLVR